MRKGLIILIPLIFFLIIFPRYDTEIRIRIIANDDTTTGLNEKQIVKEALQATLNSYIDYDIEYIIDHFIDFQATLLNQLPPEIKQKTTVSYRQEFFDAKTVNDIIVPAGIYQSIVITIGNGNGSNWWSILYPDFFDIDYEKRAEIDYRSYFYDLLFA